MNDSTLDCTHKRKDCGNQIMIDRETMDMLKDMAGQVCEIRNQMQDILDDCQDALNITDDDSELEEMLESIVNDLTLSVESIEDTEGSFDKVVNANE